MRSWNWPPVSILCSCNWDIPPDFLNPAYTYHFAIMSSTVDFCLRSVCVPFSRCIDRLARGYLESVFPGSEGFMRGQWGCSSRVVKSSTLSKPKVQKSVRTP